MFSTYVHLHMFEFLSLVILSVATIFNVTVKSSVSVLLTLFTFGLWLQYISDVYTSCAPMLTEITAHLGFALEVIAAVMCIRFVTKIQASSKPKTPPNSI